MNSLNAAIRPVAKTWLATNDSRTRITHAIANGQNVLISDTFSVGDTQLQFPGDPNGSPEEVINCRCTTLWITADDMEE
jgi:uncharacterized protein with gpF-like domain